MAQDKVVLLDLWASMFAMRVRIALSEKGIEYESREEDLLAGKSPLLLQTNPVHKKVPVLIHGDKPVCESLIIVQYIDEVWKENSPSLIPEDPFERAQAKFWADYVDQKVYDAGRKLWGVKEKPLGTDVEEFIEILKVLENELGHKSFFAGDTFGYVDVALVPFYSWFYTYETFGNFCIEKECPTLIKWAKRCIERESVAKALPESPKVYEFVLQIRKAFGLDN